MQNNPRRSSTTKISKHIPSVFSMSPISLIKDIEINHSVIELKITHKEFVSL